MNLAQTLAQFLAHAGVQRAEGFIKQQHPGFDGQCAGEGHTLTLAAGQLAGIAGADVGQLDQVEQFGDAAGDFGRVRALRAGAGAQAIGDILEHGHMLEKGIVLEHKARAAFLHRQPGGVGAFVQHAASGRVFEATQNAQQRRLARPGRAEEGHERT